MNSLEIGKITEKNGKVEIPIHYNNVTFDIWYKFPKKYNLHPQLANGVAALSMIPAMKSGTDLVIKDGSISNKLIEGLNTAQDILMKWYPRDLSKINIVAEKTKSAHTQKKDAQKKMVIACFTGGVDSFDTLLRNQDEITHLLYIHGYDIPLKETAFRKKVSAHLQTVAKKFNKELIEVETNAREFTDHIGNEYWGSYFYGPAIASVALMLAGDAAKLLVPSCQSYADLSPRASHVLLDHLWSVEDMEVVYDGAESSRTEKVAHISDNPIVQEHLRVCWQTKDAYNCSRCEKCVRTMVSLELFDNLSRTKTFTSNLDYDHIAHTELDNDATFAMAKDSLEIARQRNKSDLIRALEIQTTNYSSAKLFNQLNDNFDLLVSSKDFGKIKDRLANHLWQHYTKSMAKAGVDASTKKVVNKLRKLR